MVKNMHTRRRRHNLPDESALISCPHHPGPKEPGYMICQHIESVSDVHFFERATNSNLGVLACLVCAYHNDRHPRDTQYVVDNFILACQTGLKERHLIPLLQ